MYLQGNTGTETDIVPTISISILSGTLRGDARLTCAGKRPLPCCVSNALAGKKQAVSVASTCP